MTGVITLLDQPRTLDALGRATDAIIYFYYKGTTTLAPIYEDEELTTPATNPVEIAAGEIFPDIYLDSAIEYRRITLFGDGTIQDIPDLPVSSSGGIFTSVTDFGATGDGSTDDLAAIEAAIVGAPSNGMLIFPAGVYIVSDEITIARDDLTIMGYGAIIRAKANTSFEYVFFGTGRTNIKVIGLTFDANQSNRTTGQSVRYMGASLTLSTDCGFINCTAINALGYSSIPGVGIAIGGGTRNFITNCLANDCGGSSGTNAADGFYVSGDNCLISNSIAENCTDTGFVIESSNNSGIVGCTAKDCNATFAITNATNFDKRGNFIEACTGIDWNSAVTGGVQIGCPSSTTGNLYDTRVDVILIAPTGGKGTGPAINVRKVGTGQVNGLTIAATINGASTQGILIDGQNVHVEGGHIRGTTNACIQFATGATGSVIGTKLFGGSFGVRTEGTASVIVKSASIVGNSTQTYGLFAAGTSTIAAEACDINGQTVNRTGKDGGATLTSLRYTGSALELNGVQIIGARGAAVPDATGGATIDTEARTAINAWLARARVHGLIDS